MAKKKLSDATALVVTSNDLVLAKYNFSLWQKRIFNYFVSQIDKDATDFTLQRIYISDLIHFFDAGDGREVYEIIANVPKQLYNSSIKVPYISEEGYHRYGEMRIITRYTKPEDRELGNAYIEFKFNDDLKPHLLELKRRFLRYDMQNIVGLQSVHSVRMFEILKSYEYLGAVSFEVEFLKTVLELGEKYKLYADFRRYVIDKAREDLTKYCDIYFDYQEIKKSRKVNEIIFTIIKNTGQTAENVDFSLQNAHYTEGVVEEAVPVLRDERTLLQAHVQAWWGITQAIFQKKSVDKTDEDIKIAIEFTKEKVKEGKANNPAGVFLEALSRGYKTPKQQADALKQENEAKNNQKEQVLKQKETLLAQGQLDIRFISEELNTAINTKIRQIVEQDPTVTERAIAQVTAEFIATKRAHFVQNKSVEDFRQLPILREAVIVAIKSMYKEDFTALEQPFFSRLQAVQQKIALLK
ncbi:MAG: replication initiation protein [Saprospiraceae bacterium]|nr:replication initiation protein [Saprospiraceae bacterium]